MTRKKTEPKKKKREEKDELEERRLIDERRDPMSEVVAIDEALRARSMVAPPVTPERSRYTGHTRREKDRKKECREIMALRVAGCSNEECADVLEMEIKVIAHRISEGRSKGWITRDDDQRMQDMIEPLTIDGLTDLLIKRDKETILESARGRGLFKSHQAIKNISAQVTELRVRIEHEGGDGNGVRAALPGEIIDGTTLSGNGSPRLEEGQQPTLAEHASQEREPETIETHTGSPRTSGD